MQNPFLFELSCYFLNAYPPFVHQLNPDIIKDYIPIFILHKVTKAEFEEKLLFLKQNNYRTITVSEWKFSPRESAVCLTFDDGHKSLYEIAFPLLKKYNFSATAFIVPSFMDKPNWITWRQAEEMHRSGIIDLQSHTLEHKRIPDMQEKEIFYDLSQSKKILEDRLNKPIEHLAYPYGRGSNISQKISKDTGYLANFWGPVCGIPYNKTDCDPYKLVRLKDDYIFRLPGKERKSLSSIFFKKTYRRIKNKDIYK